jgi:hypothetical protein
VEKVPAIVEGVLCAVSRYPKAANKVLVALALIFGILMTKSIAGA